MINSITDIIQTNSWLAFFAVFLGGMLTASNPCVLVMIPLIIGYIGGKEDVRTFGRSFVLSLFLVIGLATTFTIMGIAAVATGKMFGDVGKFWPYIICAVCVIMGLHLVGIFHINIPMPQNIKIKQKGIPGAFLFGMLFGVVSVPCAVPILAVILAIIASKQSFIYGTVLLWVYAIGHCVLILIAGLSIGATKIILEHRHLNKALDMLKKISGVLIIFVGLYFLMMCF